MNPLHHFKKQTTSCLIFIILTLITTLVKAAPPQILYTYKGNNDTCPRPQIKARSKAGLYYGITFTDPNLGGVVRNLRVSSLDVSGSTPVCRIIKEFVNFNFNETPIDELRFQAPNGKLYGTADAVIDPANPTERYKIIFEIDPNVSPATYKIFYEFDKLEREEVNNLILGPDGAFYGIAKKASSLFSNLFQLSFTNGIAQQKEIFRFPSTPFASDFINPSEVNNLLFGPDGKLYGTTLLGDGAATSNPNTFGFAFRLNPSATNPNFTVLHRFAPYVPGLSLNGYPANRGLFFTNDGNLIGTTSQADGQGIYGDGLIYRITTASPTPSFKILRLIEPGAACCTLLFDNLVKGSSGNFYFGGTVELSFIEPLAASANIHSLIQLFDSITASLLYPAVGGQARIIDDFKGMLYAYTFQGGSLGHGTLFRMSAQPTKMNLTMPSTDLSVNQEITITAKLAGANPTGTVTFEQNRRTLGSATIDATGTAKLTTNTLSDPLGSTRVRIIARYPGDANNNSASADLAISIAYPIANNDSYTLKNAGKTITIPAPGILANDTDKGRPVTVAGAATPKIINLTNPGGVITGDTVTLYANGRIDYQPKFRTGFGKRQFTYQAANTFLGKSNTATVVLNIQAIPLASNDSATTGVSKAVAIPVLANDKAFGTTLSPNTVSIVNAALKGRTAIQPDGSITYTPNAGFSGVDNFNYVVKDALGNASNIATVTVTVPQAINDTFTIVANTLAAQSFTANALTNDQPLGLNGRSTVLVTGIKRFAGSGTATISPVAISGFGSFTFKLTAPATANTNALKQASKRGSYQFTYREIYKGINTAPATVTIVVR